MMTRRILFVDDESHLLAGLKRMLRPMRHEWEMEFKESGTEALECMDHTRFDVVVSDVRMSGMNGVELLSAIKDRHPQTVRLLLSGQADMELIMDAIGPTHQYLAKPCDSDLLKTTITKACALGDLLQDESVKQLVSQIESMPSLPSLYIELEEELRSSDSDMEKAAAIMAKDVGMTAKILKIVNSAFFGVPRSIIDPIQAVIFLGLETLKTLVLTITVFQQLSSEEKTGFDADRFWQHSLATGEQARRIAKVEQAAPAVVEAALTGGLLHDVGMLLLLTGFPKRYQETLAYFATQKCTLMEAEQETLGATHSQVGAYLLGLWGIPTPVIEAVAFHHHPADCLAQGMNPLIAVHVANGLIAEKEPQSMEGDSPCLELEYLSELGFAERVSIWRDLSMNALA